MANLFLILLLVSLAALVVGVINPRWAMPWASSPSRLKSSGLYAGAVVAFFVAFGVTTDNTKQPTANSQQATAGTPKKAEEPAPTPETPEELVAARMPENQKRFLEVMEEAAEEYEDAPNELVKSDIDRQRRADSKEFTPGGSVSNWVGIVEELGTNGDGNGIIAIRANSSTTFETWNNAISDIQSNTLIPHGSELYKTVSRLSEGDAVAFSGKLVDEGSATEYGSVTEPEFIVRFSNIELLH